MRVLSSLSSAEQAKLAEFDQKLKIGGAIVGSEASSLLGEPLFSKVRAAALYDMNIVSNEAGDHVFITAPGAFHKFSKSVACNRIDDVFEGSLHFLVCFVWRKPAEAPLGAKAGGEDEIRTHEGLSPPHAFQACALNHSATSPDAFLGRGSSRTKRLARTIAQDIREATSQCLSVNFFVLC